MPCWSSSSSRSYLWARAVFLPLFILAMALGLVCAFYITETTWMVQRPWRALAMVSWAPYLILSIVVMDYTDQFLPLAPVAARRGLFAVMAVGGSAFALASFFVAAFGGTSAAVALAFALAAAIAGLVALWIWVDRTYRAVDS